ncbi:hypothetical protein [Hymenobacter sp. BT491]|uniref:hypothetical protein n=1 Tax=Hymenobacter sp. BT491 TaxID=2766779 RepID=UPI001653EB3A|nr:hypothetical protein [Hymenobacter sp. BT491]MBC6992367.1 hypothetical protein [Hymenobacter sp. BT491]
MRNSFWLSFWPMSFFRAPLPTFRPRRATDLVSPRAHAVIDRLCFPLMLGCAAWAARRNKPAAVQILVNALGEGVIGCCTRFPTGLVPLLSFRTHVRIGQVGGPVFLALAYGLPRQAGAARTVALFWGLVPLVLNGLSDISDPAVARAAGFAPDNAPTPLPNAS